VKSTGEEIKSAHELVKRVEADIARQAAEGKRIHIIWDFDSVLSSPLSDDVFAHVNGDLEKYFDYEARMSMSPPRPGLWLPLAEKIGKLHSSQDIVTTRSSFLAFRVMVFCIWHASSDISKWMRWILFVGHQSKGDSFRIILESFRNDADMIVYYIDDSEKHIGTFSDISRKLGMSGRTVGIVSPKIRNYSREQFEWHYQSVMGALGDDAALVPGTPGGYANGHLVLPGGLAGFRTVIAKSFLRAEQKAVIDQFGPVLESECKDLFPGEPVTPKRLHSAFRFLQEEAIHDTMVIDEIMEEAVRSGKLE